MKALLGAFEANMHRVRGWCSILALAGIAGILCLTLVEVVARKLFNYSTLVANEVSGYLLVLAVYLSLAFALKEGEHIQVKILVSRASKRTRDWLALVWYILGLAFTVLLTYRAFVLVLESYKEHAVSLSVLRAPMYLTQSIMLIGLSLLVLEFVAEIIEGAGLMRS